MVRKRKRINEDSNKYEDDNYPSSKQYNDYFKFLKNYDGDVNIEELKTRCLIYNNNQTSEKAFKNVEKLAKRLGWFKKFRKNSNHDEVKSMCHIVDKFFEHYVTKIERKKKINKSEIKKIQENVDIKISEIIKDSIEKVEEESCSKETTFSCKIKNNKPSDEQIEYFKKAEKEFDKLLPIIKNDNSISNKSFNEISKDSQDKIKKYSSDIDESLNNLKKIIIEDYKLTEKDQKQIPEAIDKIENLSKNIEEHKREIVEAEKEAIQTRTASWSFMTLLSSVYQKIKDKLDKLSKWFFSSNIMIKLSLLIGTGIILTTCYKAVLSTVTNVLSSSIFFSIMSGAALYKCYTMLRYLFKTWQIPIDRTTTPEEWWKKHGQYLININKTVFPIVFNLILSYLGIDIGKIAGETINYGLTKFGLDKWFESSKQIPQIA